MQLTMTGKILYALLLISVVLGFLLKNLSPMVFSYYDTYYVVSYKTVFWILAQIIGVIIIIRFLILRLRRMKIDSE